jgi:hypothetical protein
VHYYKGLIIVTTAVAINLISLSLRYRDPSTARCLAEIMSGSWSASSVAHRDRPPLLRVYLVYLQVSIILHESHLPDQPSLRPPSREIPPRSQQQRDPPHPANPSIIPHRLLHPRPPPRCSNILLDHLLQDNLRVCRTSAVVQVKPTPRIESSSSSAQDARPAKLCGQSSSVTADSVTGRGLGPCIALCMRSM